MMESRAKKIKIPSTKFLVERLRDSLRCGTDTSTFDIEGPSASPARHPLVPSDSPSRGTTERRGAVDASATRWASPFAEGSFGAANQELANARLLAGDAGAAHENARAFFPSGTKKEMDLVHESI